MIPLTLEEVARLCPGRPSRQAADRRGHRRRPSTPPRRAAGDLFVAVGRGVDFADDALAAGAAAALVPEDAFARSAALGARSRAGAARVVAVTGSTAKTSTKDILAALCRPHARHGRAEGSQNNEIGLPLTLSRIEPDTEVVVVEMGTRGLGQIAELCEIARPDIGVITQIGPVHLELFGTVERVAEAKAELIARCRPAASRSCPPASRCSSRTSRGGHRDRPLRRGRRRQPRYGRADGQARLKVAALDGRWTEFSFSLPHNATNALAALAAYHALGLPLGKARRGAPGLAVALARGGGPASRRRRAHQRLLQREPALHGRRARAPRRAGGRPRRSPSSATWPSSGPERPPTTARSAPPPPGRASTCSSPSGRSPAATSRAPRASRHALGADGREGLPASATALQPGDCVLVKGSRAMGLEAIGEAVAAVPA